jgi:DNA-binding transcriptional regulator GbsR (MarR family)
VTFDKTSARPGHFFDFRLISAGQRLMFQRVLKPPMEPHDSNDNVAATEIAVADTIGRLMQFWGFKKPMGRLWTILYLSPEPVSATTLADSLKMSAGSVSMSLAELEKWGAVTRTWIPGDRKDYFLAEPSVWKLVQRVVRERELGLVKDFGASLREAESALTSAQATADKNGAAQLSYKKEQIARLNELSRAGETILKALVSGHAVDPSLLIKPSPQKDDSA